MAIAQRTRNDDPRQAGTDITIAELQEWTDEMTALL